MGGVAALALAWGHVATCQCLWQPAASPEHGCCCPADDATSPAPTRVAGDHVPAAELRALPDDAPAPAGLASAAVARVGFASAPRPAVVLAAPAAGPPGPPLILRI